MSDKHEDPGYVREARYLGFDAGLASASWVEMSESDARSILTDVDPEVMDRYEAPNLSGEWADDPTPTSLAVEIMGQDWGPGPDEQITVEDEIADAWSDAAGEAYSDALQGVACRTLGLVDDALRVEARLEARAAELRALRP